MRHTLFGMALLLSLCEAVACGTPQQNEPEAPQPVRTGTLQPQWRAHVDTEKVGTTEAPVSLQAHGRIAFDADSTFFVTPAVNGRVVRVLRAVGDYVRKGDVLMELTSADVAQMQAESRHAEEDLQLAKRELDRVESLHAHGAVSEKDLTQAKGEFKKARADSTRAASALNQLGIKAGDASGALRVVAHGEGTVVERDTYVGQEVRADQDTRLFTVSDLKTVWALTDVHETDLDGVSPGAPVSVVVASQPHKSFTGTVTHIADTVDDQSRTVKVRVVLSNNARELKPNMHALARFEGAKGKAQKGMVYIPQGAVLRREHEVYVLQVDDQGQVHKRPLKPGREIAGTVRVLEGLTEGETIVTRGAIFVEKALSL